MTLDSGLSVEELSGAITHFSFCADWPHAITAITRLKKAADGRGA
jgi:4-carboxymuconolactone decarboxylase